MADGGGGAAAVPGFIGPVSRQFKHTHSLWNDCMNVLVGRIEHSQRTSDRADLSLTRITLSRSGPGVGAAAHQEGTKRTVSCTPFTMGYAAVFSVRHGVCGLNNRRLIRLFEASERVITPC